ncbi:MAG: hypothetical protein DBX55_07625 [Verrucomicrobia bacterium]|nr:MAG: hypothetical protein DBX55_07625 [Verrucomicrobiota bacterium]
MLRILLGAAQVYFSWDRSAIWPEYMAFRWEAGRRFLQLIDGGSDERNGGDVVLGFTAKYCQKKRPELRPLFE